MELNNITVETTDSRSGQSHVAPPTSRARSPRRRLDGRSRSALLQEFHLAELRAAEASYLARPATSAGRDDSHKPWCELSTTILRKAPRGPVSEQPRYFECRGYGFSKPQIGFELITVLTHKRPERTRELGRPRPNPPHVRNATARECDEIHCPTRFLAHAG